MEIDLNPGDVLFVPSFWWHLVQNIPSSSAGITIAFNFLFSPPIDYHFRELETAQMVVESRIKKRQQLLVATRKSRKRDSIHDEDHSEILPKRSQIPKPVVQRAGTLKPYTRWSIDEERYMLAMIDQYWGDWKGLLKEGTNRFHPSRDSRQLLEKARRTFGSLRRPSPETIRSVVQEKKY